MTVLKQMVAKLAPYLPMTGPISRRILSNPFSFLTGKPVERQLLVYPVNNRSLALANDPNVVETIMLDRQGTFPKSTVLTALLEPLIGDGVFGQPGGPKVKDTRQLYVRALAHVPEARIETISQEVMDRYISRWLAVEVCHRVPICTEMARLTVDIVSIATLGRTFSEPDSLRFTELFFEYHKRCSPLIVVAKARHPAEVRSIVAGMRLDEIGEEMRRMTYQAFVQPFLEGQQEHKLPPFLQALVDGGRLDCREGRIVSSRQAVDAALDEILVMLLAGHETTASVMSWLMWELANRPAMQESAAAEVCNEPDAKSAAQAINALTQEVLRLYPPIAFYLRETTADVEFRQKQLVSGSFLVVAPWTLHRHRDHWQRPDDFEPDRWRGECPVKPARTSFMPFGIGPRTCPGARFADVEMRVILGNVLRRLVIGIEEGQSPRPLGSLTSRPDREIHLKVVPRQVG